MGKTPEKLRLEILVDEEWFHHPKVKELREKGHTVYSITDPIMAQPHLILSKHAHMWGDDMWHLLDITMKAARARKKGQESEPDKN